MPSGSVIRYEGKRGVVFRVKYRDVDGRQVMETLGPACDGWTDRKAERELGVRLKKVEKERWRKPPALTFEAAVAEWFEAAATEKRWKPRTVDAYEGIVKRLNDTFGPRRLVEIEPRDVVAYKTALLKRFGPHLVSRDLVILHQFFKWAKVAKGIRDNPTEGVPGPRLPKWKGQALAPEQVQKLLRGFEEG